MTRDDEQPRDGRSPADGLGDDRIRLRRRAALVLAGAGLFWIAALWIGPTLGLDNRGMALLDLFALAGFGLGLWMTWRSSRPRG